MWQILRGIAHSPAGVAKVSLRRQLGYLWRGLPCLPGLRAWFGAASNPALLEALAWRPSLIKAALHPYIHARWSPAHKLQLVPRHYALLSQGLPFLRLAPDQSLLLARLKDGLFLCIDKQASFQHEGELVMHLYQESSLQAPRRLMSLAFTLGSDTQGRLAWVGALQGLRDATALQRYRHLTQALEGWRPRDLLIDAFQAFCESIGVQRILAASDACRVSSLPYFAARAAVLSSYDPIWLEHHGVAVEDDWFELPPRITMRSLDEVPSRKRAQRRRRQVLVDDLQRQIGQFVRLRQRGASGSGGPDQVDRLFGDRDDRRIGVA